MKSFIDIQYFNADEKSREGSDSISPNRRMQDRRQQQLDRRNAVIMVGKARYDRRRRNDRRDFTLGYKQSPNKSTESANTQASSLFSMTAGYRSDLLRIWVMTEQVDLDNQLCSYSNHSPHICINQYSIREAEIADTKLGETCPDLILIDMRLTIPRVIEQLRMIRKSMPSVKIILLYEQNSPDFIDEIIEYRISGFLPIGIDHKLFEKAIQVVVYRGELWFSHRLIRKIFDKLSGCHNVSISSTSPPKDAMLTKSEQGIIRLVTKGLTNKQIAQQLAVSPETVKKHLKSVFIKTGVHNRSQLVSGYLFKAVDSK